MIEALWIAGLTAAALERGRRPIAVLLLIKLVASYGAYLWLKDATVIIAGVSMPGQAAPVLTDIAVATVAIPVCLSYRQVRTDIVAILFVAFMLLHWVYWSGWEVGLWFSEKYFHSMRFAYSLMVAMIFPWERMNVLVDFAHRGWMALRGLPAVFGAPSTRSRRAASGSRAGRG